MKHRLGKRKQLPQSPQIQLRVQIQYFFTKLYLFSFKSGSQLPLHGTGNENSRGNPTVLEKLWR